jgi:glycosyltransferase involved in cell wall biosynthesis
MITYFVITFESFDTPAFVRRLKEFDPNGVIVVWNYSGLIKIDHSPASIPLRESYRFYETGRWTENRWIKWSTLLLLHAWIMFQVLRRTRTRRFFVTGGDVLLWIAQIFKLLGRIDMTITTLDDWSLPPRTGGIGDKINHVKLFVNDRLLESMDTRILALTPEVLENRRRYWGREMGECTLFEERWANFLEKKRDRSARPGNEICLLGTLRRNFGIEILFELLPKLNREHGIRLRIIGPETDLYRSYKKKSESDGIASLIEWRGFVSSEDLPGELENCFCGYDMQENAVNNSKFVIAGRIVHYLQNLLVPVVSEHSGAIVPFLRTRGMGVVCSPEKDEIEKAILEAKTSSARYLDSVEEFLDSNPYRRSIREWLFL